MRPLVSVIIPTFNRAEVVCTTLESISNQDYQNLELLVIDDGSKDETRIRVEDFITTNPHRRINYFYQENQGAPVARNFGIKKSKGEYIVFFDSDDKMAPNRITKQICSIIGTQSDICGAGFTYSRSAKKYIPPSNIGNSLELFLKNELYGSTQSWMYSKEILVAVGGFDERLKCSQDLDLFFRVLCLNPKISVVRESLSIFNEHSMDERISRIADSENGLISVNLFHLKIQNHIKENFSYNLAILETKAYMSLISRYIAIGNIKIIRKLFRSSKILLSQNFNLKIYVLRYIYLVQEIMKGLIKFQVRKYNL